MISELSHFLPLILFPYFHQAADYLKTIPASFHLRRAHYCELSVKATFKGKTGPGGFENNVNEQAYLIYT